MAINSLIKDKVKNLLDKRDVRQAQKAKKLNIECNKALDVILSQADDFDRTKEGYLRLLQEVDDPFSVQQGKYEMSSEKMHKKVYTDFLSSWKAFKKLMKKNNDVEFIKSVENRVLNTKNISLIIKYTANFNCFYSKNFTNFMIQNADITQFISYSMRNPVINLTKLWDSNILQEEVDADWKKFYILEAFYEFVVANGWDDFEMIESICDYYYKKKAEFPKKLERYKQEKEIELSKDRNDIEGRVIFPEFYQ